MQLDVDPTLKILLKQYTESQTGCPNFEVSNRSNSAFNCW